MASPLWNLDFGQIGSGLKRLGERDVSPDDWSRMLADDELVSKIAKVFQAGRDYSTLLKFVGTVNLGATVGDFSAELFFKLNKEANGLPAISFIGSNFQSWFGQKVEQSIVATNLRYAQLQKNSLDGPIIAALGGEERCETSLTEIFSLMAKQKNGESGVLLNNGYANIFYVKDQTGTLRAVRVDWSGGGWFVYAHSVEDPFAWDGGNRIFSRNSDQNSDALPPNPA